MVAQYEEIVKYVTHLVNENMISGQVYSELRMICIRLGIEGFIDSSSGLTQFVTVNKIIEDLSSKSECTFKVNRVDDCNASFCDYRCVC